MRITVKAAGSRILSKSHGGVMAYPVIVYCHLLRAADESPFKEYFDTIDGHENVRELFDSCEKYTPSK